MLFVLNAAGVPSVASWVQLDERQVGMRMKRRPRKGLRATVTVDAHDPEGNASSWTRTLRVAL